VERAMESVLSSDAFDLLGYHCHIGSQIFDATGFVLAAEKIFTKVTYWKETFQYEPKVVNLGGGFGIRYTEEDEPMPATYYVEKIVESIKQQVKESGIAMPE
ncbi:diaminopimelate decarboxylase, partial [Metabacillus sp. JX24]